MVVEEEEEEALVVMVVVEKVEEFCNGTGKGRDEKEENGTKAVGLGVKEEKD